jgi:hypothetical protein
VSYWLGLFVLPRSCRQNRLYETLSHTVIILNKHHHHQDDRNSVGFLGGTSDLWEGDDDHFDPINRNHSSGNISYPQSDIEQDIGMYIHECIYMYIYICIFVNMYMYTYIY